MKGVWPFVVLTAAVRLAVFPWNQNVAGDAVARTWLALDWAAAPHWMTSFQDLTAQFGPLHLMLVGAASWLIPEPMLVGRLVSLGFGVATVLPLYALAARLSGEKGAAAAATAFAVWGLHVQVSTTAASEALCLWCALHACDGLARWFDGGARRWLGWAALSLSLGCAVRYDLWLWIPLLTVSVALRRGVRWAVVFGAGAASFPTLWMLGNWLAVGDPLAPLRYIDDFHRQWAQAELAAWGPVWFRLGTAAFWPACALLSLSPVAAWWGGRGLWRALRTRREWAWLVALVVVPAALSSLRGAVLTSFVPLARFTVKELALLVVLVGPGVERSRWGLWVAALWTVGWATASVTLGGAGEQLAPLSAVSRNPARLHATLADLRTRTASAAQGVLVLDADPRGYDELQLKAYGGLPRERVANLRAKNFDLVLAAGEWRWLVKFDGGSLPVEPTPEGDLVFRGVRFVPSPATPNSPRVYLRAQP